MAHGSGALEVETQDAGIWGELLAGGDSEELQDSKEHCVVSVRNAQTGFCNFDN